MERDSKLSATDVYEVLARLGQEDQEDLMLNLDVQQNPARSIAKGIAAAQPEALVATVYDRAAYERVVAERVLGMDVGPNSAVRNPDDTMRSDPFAAPSATGRPFMADVAFELAEVVELPTYEHWTVWMRAV